MFQSLRITDERAAKVTAEITVGSHPRGPFFALLITASMIASFGLIADSTAVIIGAMLVSPLMTPIFGIALGMLRGLPDLVGAAVRAEVLGVILAVGSAFAVGSFDLLGTEATSEMLSRTRPNLIDLLVAVFAGLAGSYALVDERISPALPGVAIATAIVPPLSTCGLCLALGAWQGAGGALLLFVANVVSILVVALAVFAVTGLATTAPEMSWSTFARRYGPTMIGFVVVTVVLTKSLFEIAERRAITLGIRETFLGEFAADPSVDLEDFRHHIGRDGVQVLATVRSPQIVKPRRVAELEEALERELDRTVDLVVRTSLSKDVTRAGAHLVVQRPDLDGAFLDDRSGDAASLETLAEQVIREQFQDEPGFELTQVDFGRSPRDEGIVVAYVNSLRRLAPSEIAVVEDALRERFEDPYLQFFARIDSAQLESRRGPVRVEWSDRRTASHEQMARLPEEKKVVREVAEELLGAIPVNVQYHFVGDRRRILLEVVGPDPISREDVHLCQSRVREELGDEYDLFVWFRSDYVVDPEGYSTYDELTRPDLDRRSRILRDLFRGKTTTAEADTRREVAPVTVP